MFDNIGSKVKGQAVALCWCGIILSVIAEFAMWIAELGFFWGLLVIVFGSLLSWLNSQFYYAIGEAAEKATLAADRIEKIAKELSKEKPEKNEEPKKETVTPAVVPPVKPIVHTWLCPDCGAQISQTPCPHCKKPEPATELPIPDFTLSYCRPTKINDTTIRCIFCRTEQSSENATCSNCGAKFLK